MSFNHAKSKDVLYDSQLDNIITPTAHLRSLSLPSFIWYLAKGIWYGYIIKKYLQVQYYRIFCALKVTAAGMFYSDKIMQVSFLHLIISRYPTPLLATTYNKFHFYDENKRPTTTKSSLKILQLHIVTFQDSGIVLNIMLSIRCSWLNNYQRKMWELRVMRPHIIVADGNQ
ncbi:hypothetical protein BDA99DRAFT_541857 [Phascolomyces articulosus]|uniref:Uncharacterized protein n=1 Tax=Phascolomyces articulosus TaxID=60185 RepID=A0AAD5P9C5_9FUNG|nr:hypothetical protein BDA99DRAFT_541857 [Phascolomyces articulosus]